MATRTILNIYIRIQQKPENENTFQSMLTIYSTHIL